MTLDELIAAINEAPPAERFDVLDRGMDELEEPADMRPIIRGDLEEMITAMGANA